MGHRDEALSPRASALDYLQCKSVSIGNGGVAFASDFVV